MRCDNRSLSLSQTRLLVSCLVNEVVRQQLLLSDRHTVKFGKIIGSGKRLADPDKISVVEGMKPPKTQREVRRILGFFGYFRDQIPNYAEIAKPLTDQTTKRHRTHILCKRRNRDVRMILRYYFVSDFKLPIVSIARDSGVLIDSRLTFRDHIKSVVSRGHLRAMQIWRCFLCKDTDILIKAFTTYVRPLLECCSPAWSPTSLTLVNDLESSQRRYTKRLPGFNLISYDDRCARVGIDRLELRRLRADSILCYKILHCLVLPSSGDFFHNCSQSSYWRT